MVEPAVFFPHGAGQEGGLSPGHVAIVYDIFTSSLFIIRHQDDKMTDVASNYSNCNFLYEVMFNPAINMIVKTT